MIDRHARPPVLVLRWRVPALPGSPRRDSLLASMASGAYNHVEGTVSASKPPIAQMRSWEEPYVTLHVVWHPQCSDSDVAARHLIEHFTRERSSIDEMGVSVFEWSSPPAGSSLLASVALGGEPAVVVALIGDEIQRDSAWSTYVRELAERCLSVEGEEFRRCLVPVAMTSRTIATDLGVQALRWYDWGRRRDSRAQRLVREVTYAASRLLRTLIADAELSDQLEKVRVFLSHSKHDGVGERVAQRIRDWLHNDVQLSVFLDVVGIPAGFPPDRVLEEEVRRSAILVVYSDSFSSREWCGREVLVAKENDRPIVVADCIEGVDERSFPYLGNVPVVRLGSQLTRRVERVVGRLLDEIFKDFLWRCRTAALSRDNPHVKFVARAPELLTAVNTKAASPETSAVVYPDPPLNLREHDLMKGLGIEFLSLSQWMTEERNEAPR